MSELHDRLRTLLFLVPYVVRHRGVEVAELTKRLGIPQEQLVREINFLLMVGRPPFFPDDMVDIYNQKGRVFVDLHQSLDKPPALTVFEALALASAARLFAEEDRMGEASVAVKVAIEKIVASLPEDTRTLFDELAGQFLMMPGGSDSPDLAKMRKAIDERLELDLEYFTASRGKVTKRTVRPYGLYNKNGVWYLAAFCTKRESVRVFRLSRVQDSVLTDRIFDFPEEGFDTADFVEKSLTIPAEGEREIIIRFSPSVARWVRERWGPEYLQDTADGGLTASLHDVSDEYVLSYVASFGAEATIVAPRDLAERMHQQARAALARYK